MSGIMLGPNHPDYGRPLDQPAQRRRLPRERAPRTARFQCSACGAEKPAARSLCACGAFARPPKPAGPKPQPGDLIPCIGCGAPRAYGRRCYVCLPRRWAREYDACRTCGRNDSEHAGRGLCKRCTNLQRYRNGYRPQAAPSVARVPGPDGVTRCRRCETPVEPGRQCATCRVNARRRRHGQAVGEIGEAGNLGRQAV